MCEKIAACRSDNWSEKNLTNTFFVAFKKYKIIEMPCYNSFILAIS